MVRLDAQTHDTDNQVVTPNTNDQDHALEAAFEEVHDIMQGVGLRRGPWPVPDAPKPVQGPLKVKTPENPSVLSKMASAAAHVFNGRLRFYKRMKRTLRHTRREKEIHRNPHLQFLENREVLSTQNLPLDFATAFGAGSHPNGMVASVVNAGRVEFTTQSGAPFTVDTNGAVRSSVANDGIIEHFLDPVYVDNIHMVRSGPNALRVDIADGLTDDYRDIANGETVLSIKKKITYVISSTPANSSTTTVIGSIQVPVDVPDPPPPSSYQVISAPVPTNISPQMEEVTQVTPLTFTFPGVAADNTTTALDATTNITMNTGWGRYGVTTKNGGLVTMGDVNNHNGTQAAPLASDHMILNLSPALASVTQLKINRLDSANPAQLIANINSRGYVSVPSNGIIAWDGSPITSVTIVNQNNAPYSLAEFDKGVKVMQPSILVHPPATNPLDSGDIPNGNELLKAHIWQYNELKKTLNMQFEAGTDVHGVAAMDNLSTLMVSLTTLATESQKQLTNITAASLAATTPQQQAALAPAIADAQAIADAITALNTDWQRDMRKLNFKINGDVTDEGKSLDTQTIGLAHNAFTVTNAPDLSLMKRDMPEFGGQLTVRTLRGQQSTQPVVVNADTSINVNGGRVSTLDFTSLKSVVTGAAFHVTSENASDIIVMTFMRGENVLYTLSVPSGAMANYSDDAGITGVIIENADASRYGNAVTVSDMALDGLAGYGLRDVPADMSLRNSGVSSKSQPNWNPPANYQQTNSNVYFYHALDNPHGNLNYYVGNPNPNVYSRFDVHTMQGTSQIASVMYLSANGMTQLPREYYDILDGGTSVIVRPGASPHLVLEIQSNGQYNVTSQTGAVDMASVRPPNEFTLQSGIGGVFTGAALTAGFSTNAIDTSTMKPQRVYLGNGHVVGRFENLGMTAGTIRTDVYTGYASSTVQATLVGQYQTSLSANTPAYLDVNLSSPNVPSQPDEPMIVTFVTHLPNGMDKTDTMLVNTRANQVMNSSKTKGDTPRPVSDDELTRLARITQRIIVAAQDGKAITQTYATGTPLSLDKLYAGAYKVIASSGTTGSISSEALPHNPDGPVLSPKEQLVSLGSVAANTGKMTAATDASIGGIRIGDIEGSIDKAQANMSDAERRDASMALLQLYHPDANNVRPMLSITDPNNASSTVNRYILTETAVGQMFMGLYANLLSMNPQQRGVVGLQAQAVLGIRASTLVHISANNDYSFFKNQLVQEFTKKGFGNIFLTSPDAASSHQPFVASLPDGLSYLDSSTMRVIWNQDRTVPATAPGGTGPTFDAEMDGKMDPHVGIYIKDMSNNQIDAASVVRFYGNFADVRLDALSSTLRPGEKKSFNVYVAHWSEGMTNRDAPPPPFTIEVTGDAARAAQKLSTNSDPEQARIEDAILTQVKAHFPLDLNSAAGQHMKAWLIGSGFHHGDSYDAVDLDIGNSGSGDRTSEEIWGVPVLAMADGIVSHIDEKFGTITLQHDANSTSANTSWYSEYMHTLLRNKGTQPGDDGKSHRVFEVLDKDLTTVIRTIVEGVTTVKAGDRIGSAGGAGTSNGQFSYTQFSPHLHERLYYFVNNATHEIDQRKILKDLGFSTFADGKSIAFDSSLPQGPEAGSWVNYSNWLVLDRRQQASNFDQNTTTPTSWLAWSQVDDNGNAITNVSQMKQVAFDQVSGAWYQWSVEQNDWAHNSLGKKMKWNTSSRQFE